MGDWEKKIKLLEEDLKNMTGEEREKWFPKDTTPKGWVSIEENLPKWLGKDIEKGGTEYRVKYKDGKEGTSIVSDHNVWYYHAKEVGITHWYNE